MKRSDIAMIILIASMSVLVAYFVAKSVLGDGKSEAVTVKTADPISDVVDEPSDRVFREGAINPTVEVFIGEGGQSAETAQ
jgi:hypothetical protein